MSLGFSSNLKGDAKKQTTIGGVKTTPVFTTMSSDTQLTSKETILTFPDCSGIVYTSIQVTLVCLIVGALWVMAAGLWEIKHYVECNQGVVAC